MNSYTKGALITAAIGFLVIWFYALSTWGLLFGLLFGWLPALIGAAILGLIWPVVLAVAIIVYLKLQGAF